MATTNGTTGWDGEILQYKGYRGSVEYSPEDHVLFGKVLGVRGLFSYEGRTRKDLEEDFRQAVEAMIKLEAIECDAVTPEQWAKGQEKHNMKNPWRH